MFMAVNAMPRIPPITGPPDGWFITRLNCNLKNSRRLASTPSFFLLSFSHRITDYVILKISILHLSWLLSCIRRKGVFLVSGISFIFALFNFFVSNVTIRRYIYIYTLLYRYVKFLVIGKIRLQVSASLHRRAWKGVINPVPIPLNPKLGIYWLSKLP